MKHQFFTYKQGERGARKYLKPALVLAFLLGSMACGNVWAQHGGHNGGHNGGHGFAGHGFHDHGFHGRGRVGVFVGAPLFWYGYDPFWYGYPYYGYPYYQAPPPAAYVEQGLNPAAAKWYYCSQPAGYYPYVKNCSTAWRAVTPPAK